MSRNVKVDESDDGLDDATFRKWAGRMGLSPDAEYMVRPNQFHDFDDASFDPLKLEDDREDPLGYTIMPPSLNVDDTSPSNYHTPCIFRYSLKGQVLSTPGFPAPIPKPSHDTPCYVIRASTDFGRGMYATRGIAAGDLILAERPMFVGPPAANVQMVWRKGFSEAQRLQVSYDEWEKLLQRVFEKMPAENFKAYMALANSHEHDGSGPLLGRFRTNGLGIEPLQDPTRITHTQHSGIGKDISLLNHSCRPNTGRFFDIATFCFQLRAARHIAAGEEITIQYTDSMAPYADRQEALKPYGFQCTCDACKNYKVSDKRRRTFTTRLPLFHRWLEDRTLPGDYVIKECQSLIAGIKEEGLEGYPAHREYLELISKCYNALGDEGQSAAYYTQVKNWYRMEKTDEGAKDALAKLSREISDLYRARVPLDAGKKKKKKAKKVSKTPGSEGPGTPEPASKLAPPDMEPLD